MKHIILFLSVISLWSGTIASGEPSEKNTLTPVFTLSSSGSPEVGWRGKPLISGEKNSWIPKMGAGGAEETLVNSEIKGWRCKNLWSDRKPLPYRKETGISPDGKKVEISFQFHQDALMDSFPAPVITHKILIPISTLNNSSWEALTGRSYSAKWSSGELNSGTPDGNLTGAPARWISFTTPAGKITFDFNPHGISTYYVTEINAIQSQWTIEKKGDLLELSFGAPATNFGGAFTSKVTIFEGDRNDYFSHHAVGYYHYFSEIPAEKLFCFGGKSSVSFINAGQSGFDSRKGYGWKRGESLQLMESDLTGALYGSVRSERRNSFVAGDLRPGLYLVTIRSSSFNRETGPFNISLNHEKIFSGMNIEKGLTATFTCVRWIENGRAEIGFEGDWSVSVIGLQLFMHSDEDYSFRRGFWIKNNGYCPDVLFANYYDTAPVYGKSVSFSTLAGKVEDIQEIPELPDLGTSLPDQKSQGLLWRYTSPLGTLGPDNYGSFNEFNSGTLIKKRLEQIKAGGVEAVIINGFLSRHTFNVHLKRVEENIGSIVTTGHEMGMKFLDHQDLTILWNQDMGFRFIAEHPEFLQHSITTGLPTWGICPVNPLFKNEYFFPYILNHVRATDLDGLMIDECTFHGSNFCNCDYCRADFTRLTGLLLPDDETSSLLRNRNSKLWKAWIEWRKNAIAQWRIDLSKAVHNIKPEFCNIQYYSEGGFMQDYASYEQGGDLALSARSMDFLGTEIMSRDVWDDYRYNFTSRHMYNSLRETYNSPVFGLVYPAGRINNAIIGWAMNNMVAQVTWSLGGETGFKQMDNYTGWKENMNFFNSVPFVDIALIFSRKTRDWSVKNRETYSEELMGTSQFLAGKQIQHTFILDDALLNQNLSRFRIILAPGMECVSDEQAEKLKSYVDKGGKLFLTGEAGRFTSFGEPRKTWIFGDILSDDVLRNLSDTSLAEAAFGNGRVYYCARRYGLNEFCNSFTLGNTYRFSPDREITELNEKFFRKILGTKLSFKSVSMPLKVLASVYTEIRDGRKVTLVHLLNAMGVKAKEGDILPLPSPDWERIKGEMIFEISLPSVSDSYYATPDTPGHKPVQVEKLSEGRFKITVPEGTVDKYGIVYLWQ